MRGLAMPFRFFALAGAWIVAGALLPAFAQNNASPAPAPADVEEVVYCHDAARDIVQRTLVGNCDGEIVTPEQAEQIRADALDRRRQLFAKPRKATIPGRQLRSIGTGFFVTADSKLVTNNHVVDDCAGLSVEMPDGRKAEGQVLATLPQDDLALISTTIVPKAVATFLQASALAAGAPITLIGYPDQGLAPIRPLLTHGELGTTSILAGARARFEIRADVRHGNSGGPVVDSRALVIGVVYAKVNSVAVFQATGKSVRFVGAVIDNRAVLAFLDQHKIAYQTAVEGPVVDAATLESRLKGIVARVGCWK